MPHAQVLDERQELCHVSGIFMVIEWIKFHAIAIDAMVCPMRIRFPTIFCFVYFLT